MNLQIIFYVLIYAAAASADVACGPGDTFLVNPDNCGSYYLCSNGVPWLQSCGSLVFDPNLNVCVFPSSYDCPITATTTTKAEPIESTTEYDESTTENDESTTESTEITSEPTESSTEPREETSTDDSEILDPCYGFDDIFLVNPDDCSTFYKCANGVSKLFRCPTTNNGSLLVFDPSEEKCVWNDEYDCTVTEPPTTEPPTTEPPTTEPPTTEPPTTEPPTTEPPTTEPPTTEPPTTEPPTTEPPTTEPPTTEPPTTEPPTTEPPTTEPPTTEPPTTEPPATEPPTTKPPTTEPPTLEPVDPCHGVIYLVNPEDCGSFYQCSNGEFYLQPCPGTLVFDPSAEKCVYPYEYDCTVTEPPTTEPPTTEPPTTEPPTTEPPTTEPPTTEPPTTEPPTTEPPTTEPPTIEPPTTEPPTTEPPTTEPPTTEPPTTEPPTTEPPTTEPPTTEPPTTEPPTTEPLTTEPPTTEPPTTEPPTTEPPTTEPPTTEPPTTEPVDPCHGVIYLVNPEDCGSFYQCSNGELYLQQCAGTLIFDPSLEKCVWPDEYDCPITESPTTEPPTTEPVDPCHGVIYLVNPEDCGSFYQCSNGEFHLQQCPAADNGTLVFDPNLNVCVWSTQYNCKDSTPPDNPCHEFRYPNACTRSPHNCSFCYDNCFQDDTHRFPRCDTYDNLIEHGCQTFNVNRTECGIPVIIDRNCSNFIPVDPGTKRNFSVTFSLEKHPLDLYYLMDFSGSMHDDKMNVLALSADLVKTIKNLTDDYRIGFGTFVDKPTPPFGADFDYSFHNDFPLTSATDDLVQRIEDIPILFGDDDPEAHGDALSQVVECAEQIGWRDNSRHVVLLATDIHFHIAGDGAEANINDPYVDGCYLDSRGAYANELTMDYPSIQQLASAYSRKQATTTVIFATSYYTVAFYEYIASQFKSAYVGELDTDSSNVLELLREEFAKIESRMEIEKSDTTDSVTFRYFSNCLNSDDELETVICENLPSSGEVTFTVEIDLAECPKDKDETGMRFDLNPVGLPIFVDVELGFLCD